MSRRASLPVAAADRGEHGCGRTRFPHLPILFTLAFALWAFGSAPHPVSAQFLTFGKNKVQYTPAATSTSPTCGRVKVLHPVGDGTGAC